MGPVVIRQKHMNCSWEISAFPQPFLTRKETLELIEEAFEVVANVEKDFTVFKDSPFNHINKNAGKGAVKVNQETLALLKLSAQYFKSTKGIFDITYQSLGSYNFNDILINESDSTVYLPHEDMKISLGGIGKGYAVDKAFHFLKQQGLINFKVNGSGDIRVHSHESAPRRWKIGITNPFNQENTMGVLYLTNEALATSGTYKKGDHIQGAKEVISTTIIGKDAITCDVLGTVCTSLSIQEAINYLNQENIFGILVNVNGQVSLSNKALNSFNKYSEKYHEKSTHPPRS